MSEQFPGYHHVYTPTRWQNGGSAALIRGMVQRGELAGVKYGGKLIRITAATVSPTKVRTSSERRSEHQSATGPCRLATWTALPARAPEAFAIPHGMQRVST